MPCTAFWLCLPLQNNNLKWLTSACFEGEPQRLIFYIFFWNWTLSVHVQPVQVFRLTGILNRFTQLRHSKVKYKYIFLQDFVPTVTVVIAKTPSSVRCAEWKLTSAAPWGNNVSATLHLKGHCHAVWQHYKKLEGIFASIEFQN